MKETEDGPGGHQHDWHPIREWPERLRGQIEDLRELESIYALLQVDGPADHQAYGLGMGFLREARRGLRVSITQGILDAHAISSVIEEEAI